MPLSSVNRRYHISRPRQYMISSILFIETNCGITYDLTRGTQTNKRRADASALPSGDSCAHRHSSRQRREAGGPVAAGGRARDRAAPEGGRERRIEEAALNRVSALAEGPSATGRVSRDD